MNTLIVLLLLTFSMQLAVAKKTCDSSLSMNGTCPCPDVVMDVPNLWVDTLELLVGHLEAHVSLEAKAANMVSLSVGAAVTIEDVDVLLREVSAQQVKLVVRLGNVNKIIDRTLNTLDRNPGLYISNTVGETGILQTNVTGTGLIEQRMVDQFANIIDRIIDEDSGVVIHQNVTASALDFKPYISRTMNNFGLTVLDVRDTATQKIIEVIVDGDGNVMSTRIVI